MKLKFGVPTGALVGPWLYRVTINMGREAYRKRVRRQGLLRKWAGRSGGPDGDGGDPTAGVPGHERSVELWEAIQRRTFPGSVSNHHLGTMVGLLMAVYEMNHFKDAYQFAVIANTKAFARALSDCGLQVAGDPGIGFTETHQVLVDVGYARGPQIAKNLEANHIICNYQAGPEDESFSASGMLRMGVSEMTRFGMGSQGFEQLAQLIRDVIVDDKAVGKEVSRLRQNYLEIEFCFKEDAFESHLKTLLEMVV